jgi:hypothetical protein
MLSQKEFVENCYNWYREADLQPGNPEDGVWDAAHYPIPSCKDGTETILLLREHHAIQGVIQSEELQWKCLWGWEEKYLTGEYLELYNKWKSEGSRLQWEVLPVEEKILRSEKARARALVQNAQMSEEKKVLKAEKLRAWYAQLTEEEKTLRAERARAKALAQWSRMTEEEKLLDTEKKRNMEAQLTEEEKALRSEKGRARALAQHARKREREAQELLARWKQGVVRW